MKSLRKILLSGVAIMAAAPLHAQASDQSPPPPAHADSSASESAADIVVTATRRETRLQTTASSVNAVTAAEIRSRNIVDVQSLASATPGMQFGSLTGAQAHIAIRGVGSDSASIGQDPRVAYYQDGVYIARPTQQLGSVFDLERIEVLRGPQGALYGRNATGGAVNVISKRPTEELDGYLRASYGNYNAVTLDGAAGSAIAPGLSARLALHYENRDGYGKNITTGHDVDDKNAFGVRFSLLWEASSQLSFLTIADYNRERDHAYGLHFFGQANPAVPILGIKLGGTGLNLSHDVASSADPLARIRNMGINETITLDTDFATLKSITSYRYGKARVFSDYDGTSTPIYAQTSWERAKQFSQELTANGDIGRFEWLLGALYFHEKENLLSDGQVSAAAIGGPLTTYYQGLHNGGTLETDAFAPYAELTFHVTDTIAVRAGGRYTHEKKTINDFAQFDLTRVYSPTNPILQRPGFPRSAHVSYNNFVPSATIEWKASPNIFAYAKYSEGFKSGNYNVSVNQPPFAPEKIKSYEIGLKTTIPELNGIFNIAGFYYDYTNLQVSVVRSTNAVIENAASAKIKGVEALARIEPFRGFTIEASGTYLDSHYSDFVSTNPVFAAAGPQDLSGNQLTQAPKWSLNGSIQQQVPLGDGKLTGRLEANYVSRVFFTPFNELPISQAGYTLLSGNIRYDLNDHWSIEAFARNITGKKAIAQAIASSGLWGFPVVGTIVPPSTYGVRVGYNF